MSRHDGTTYGADWTAMITGTASSNSGAETTISTTTVALEDTTTGQCWNGTSFGSSSQSFVPVTGTTTWLLYLVADDLTSGDNYSVVAQATDSAGYVGTSSAVTFTYDVTPNNPVSPTVSITYPVDGTTYGGDWTAMLTGTASAGAGATVKSTEAALEDTTTDQWWNGTSFSASSQSFVPVTGTTTWLLYLVADDLTSGDNYSVVAQATDSAGYVGTSSTVTFTYDVTNPATPP